MIAPAVVDAVAAALGSPVVAADPVGGGCINDGHRVRLADGRTVFVKSHPDPPSGFFAFEAAGLEWLRSADALAVPDVLHVGATHLVLEWIDSGPPVEGADERLGRGLAALHAAGAPTFGWDRDGWCGEVPIANDPTDDWAAFYAEQRLGPLVRRCVDSGRLTAGAAEVVDRVVGRLPELAGPAEPPARLHGDLWGGNVVVDTGGRPWVIDPSPYGGHREVDLAMLRLFGGVGGRAFAAYDEVHPLADGHAERTGLWQLYPLLVHTLLFGGGYGAQALTVAGRYA